MNAWALSRSIGWHWIFTEIGKGTKDGADSDIKCTIKAQVHHCILPKCSNPLLQYLPVLSNIIIDTYDESDVEVKKLYLNKVNAFRTRSIGMGISTVYEIHCNAINNSNCEWKLLSKDAEYGEAIWNS